MSRLRTLAVVVTGTIGLGLVGCLVLPAAAALRRTEAPSAAAVADAPDLLRAMCPACAYSEQQHDPWARDLTAGPDQVVLRPYAFPDLDQLWLSCTTSSVSLDGAGPPPVAGSRGDEVGTELFAWVRALGAPPGKLRDTARDLGLGPADLGAAAGPYSPWLGLIALDAEREWSEQAPRSDRSREAERDLARALQAQWPDSAVAERAALYELETLLQDRQDEQAREAATALALDLLNRSDDPLVLAWATQGLLRARPESMSPQILGRFADVVDRLPAAHASDLSVLATMSAWSADDADLAAAWWEQAEHHHARGVEGVAASCFELLQASFRPVLLHHEALPLEGLHDRLALAGARCRVKLATDPDPGPLPPDSKLGRCVQRELGSEPVLGTDVELVFTP